MMIKENIYCGLDLGTTKICAVICEIKKENKLSLLGTGISLSAGISNGTITNSTELKKAIQKAIQRAEQEAGISAKKVCVTLPSLGLEFVHNNGILVSKSESGQITSTDKRECIQRSKNLALSSEKKLLHAIALNYKVEDHYVENPVGVFGRRLEVQSHLILTKSNLMNNLIQILKECGLFINGIMYDGLALSSTLLTPAEQLNGALIVDFGGTATKISFYKKYTLQKSLVIPVGSDSLTKDIATCLKVSIPEAERLKILYGNVYVSSINPDENIDITTLTEGTKKIKLLLLAQIIESRVKEIFLYCLKNISELSEENYPVIYTGGGALIKGFMPFCKDYINPKSKDGIREDIKNILESSLYATAIGTLLYGINRNAIKYKEEKNKFFKQFKQFISMIKK